MLSSISTLELRAGIITGGGAPSSPGSRTLMVVSLSCMCFMDSGTHI